MKFKYRRHVQCNMPERGADGVPGQQEMDDVPHKKHEEPLFIKVPEYRDILQDLVGVKQILSNMKESLEVLHEVQQVKEQSIEVFVENVERLNHQLDDIDMALPEIEEMDVHVAEDISHGDVDEEEVIDDAVKDLQHELEDLRGELSKIE